MTTQDQQAVLGAQLRTDQVNTLFTPSIGQFLIKRLMEQMAQVPAFTSIFGPMKAYDNDQQRWASYEKFDWSIRQLPAVAIYEKEPENKESANAYMNGGLAITVFWPPQLRRGDLTQIPRAYKGYLENFFESDLVKVLLDPHPTVNVDTKVPGLNEIGKMITWTPQVEGIVAQEAVPVTILDIKYRIDLRAWYRYLESIDFTKENPFAPTLQDFTRVEGEYVGELDDGTEQIEIADGFDIVP